MGVESQTLISRIAIENPNDATETNRRKATTEAGQGSGKIRVVVPATGSKLWVKFGDVAVSIDSTSAATLRAETSAWAFEVGEIATISTGGAAYVVVYSAAVFEVNLHEVES